ncbi:MAG: hypothetical protein JSV91_05640 [Phycisphaerales bacterium]|nr:MAG: hypothetical protein JSV91_05640 [Phycisphaerales bacterium]
MADLLLQFIKRNRDQIIVAVIATSVGGAGMAAIGTLLQDRDPRWLLAAVGFLICVVVSSSVLIQARLIHRASIRIRDVVVHEFGHPWRETQYHQRAKHFVEEKRRLAEVLVEQELPTLVRGLAATHPNAEIYLILDSGSTITPVFRPLVRAGIGLEDDDHLNIQVYTNNLAGIEELQKLDQPGGRVLQPDQFTLIGGHPLDRYRATTGDETEQFLDALWQRQTAHGANIVTVGVLTANWLLYWHDHITLCARGRGHPEFKRSVAGGSQHLILIAPLGKILSLSSVDRLNAMMMDAGEAARWSGDQRRYEAIEIPREKTDRAILLTSRRPRHSLSPLHSLSNRLFGEKEGKDNFDLSEFCPEYEPYGSNQEVFNIELPHIWTRDLHTELFC